MLIPVFFCGGEQNILHAFNKSLLAFLRNLPSIKVNETITDSVIRREKMSAFPICIIQYARACYSLAPANNFLSVPLVWSRVGRLVLVLFSALRTGRVTIDFTPLLRQNVFVLLRLAFTVFSSALHGRHKKKKI